ncbi:hypothetical protein NDN11_10340 [Acinetobacter sp. C26M]|uniref:hypothetical protein n=1 Tax=unclassified Acinetobacter TaxID=196816 RepID=UPI002036CF2C|nr:MULTISPECIES: hypothetical protein [unclassified Acinetobacter]USA45133.1 hypothetical protein NDN11_10340 [Acinetobacter sp. C26M]USA48635.1 hypothetical protein NDN12_10340 [Acinetobacter sp. C26G]
MKKIVVGVIGLAACLMTVNGWADEPLQVNYGTPQALGQRTVQPIEQSYRSETSSGIERSIFAEYYGSRLKSDEIDGHEKLNGIGTGITFTALDTLNSTFGLNYQKNADWKSTEISVKGGYKFYNYDNTYANASIGVGYAWLKADNHDVKLRYVTLPIEFELGHYIQSNVAGYVGLGYKWLYIENFDDVCSGYFCDGTASDILDMDGITYKAGIRYNF